jgi:hypothetical protein
MRRPSDTDNKETHRPRSYQEANARTPGNRWERWGFVESLEQITRCPARNLKKLFATIQCRNVDSNVGERTLIDKSGSIPQRKCRICKPEDGTLFA